MLLLLAGAVAGRLEAQSVAPRSECDRVARELIVAAISEVVGSGSTIDATLLACEAATGETVDAALPEPGARFGRPVRFRLMGKGRQQGYAVATVGGTIAHVRTSRAIAARSELEEADLAVMSGDASGALIERFPQVDEILGAQPARSLAAGEIVTERLARVPPAVRSGEEVVIKATLGAVHVTAAGTAQQSGGIGDVIRLVNRDSRRVLRGRIVGKGLVEVIHGS